MVACRKCKENVAEDANTCPNCGINSPGIPGFIANIIDNVKSWKEHKAEIKLKNNTKVRLTLAVILSLFVIIGFINYDNLGRNLSNMSQDQLLNELYRSEEKYINLGKLTKTEDPDGADDAVITSIYNRRTFTYYNDSLLIANIKQMEKVINAKKDILKNRK